jgi:DNA-binding TFAR19-related protein (PDSD5 family)
LTLSDQRSAQLTNGLKTTVFPPTGKPCSDLVDKMRLTHRKRKDRLEALLLKSNESAEAYEHSRGISYASKGVVTAIIVMCQRLVKAEKNLTPVRFDEFCRSQKLSKRSSLFKKFKVIGNNGRRLFDHSFYLPCSLDSLYQCASLKEGSLQDLIKEGRIHRFITDAELKTVIRSSQQRTRPKRRTKRQVATEQSATT